MGVGTHGHFVENSSLNAPIHLKFIWKTILHQNLQQMILFFSNSDQYALPPLLAHLLLPVGICLSLFSEPPPSGSDLGLCEP